MRNPMPLAATMLAAGLLSAGDSRAETFHTCTGTIASVPTTISTQGVWCMTQDLSSNVTSGTLITIAANNVTIDCNGYKLGGLGAGITTETIGILAQNRVNATIRGCNIRGFRRPINIFGAPSSGHSIVDNRIESGTETGIYVAGTGIQVARNLVIDSGGAPFGSNTFGIFVGGDGDVVDNRVDGVAQSGEDGGSGTYGIAVVGAAGAVIRGNHVRNIDGGIGLAYGISVYGGIFATVNDNDIANGDAAETFAIYCDNEAIVSDNRVFSFGSPLTGCDDDGGNIAKP